MKSIFVSRLRRKSEREREGERERAREGGREKEMERAKPPTFFSLHPQGFEEGRYWATWKRKVKLPWRKTDPLKSSR